MQEGLVVLNIRARPVLMNPKAEFFLGTNFNHDLVLKDLFHEPKLIEAIDQMLTSEPKELKTRLFRTELNGVILQFRIDPIVRGEEIGMNEDDIKNLFQEFFRVRNRQTSGISGTGLGLATVKRVLSEYNGKINVQSQPEKGNIFTVTLPHENQ